MRGKFQGEGNFWQGNLFFQMFYHRSVSFLFSMESSTCETKMFRPILACFVIYFAFIVSNTVAQNDDKSLLYTAETFPLEVPRNHHFIMFYAPWCAHCKRLNPTWEELAEMLNDDPENPVVIAKVDCTVDSSLCAENDITGYPTLKFFKIGSTEGVKFRGTRDLKSLTSFINEQLGVSSSDDLKLPPVTMNGLTELTDSSYRDYVSKGNFFVKFYAPWCGFCQKLAGTWEDLAKSFEDDTNVGIARIDCTIHRNACNNMEIKGYPTLLWIQDGKVIEKYSGPRTEMDLRKFVLRMLEAREEKMKEEEDEAGGGMITLNADNFRQGISSGLSFVKFFAPWCGHCKRLAPIWNDLNKKIAGISNVRLVKVDCTQDNSKELCNEQEVEGFPTLYLYKNGERISEYNGSRNLEDMFEFLWRHFPHDEL